MARALINVPATARKGEIIAIKTLIQHEMETGYRHDHVGKQVPRDIISLFTCKYNGQEIMRAELVEAQLGEHDDPRGSCLEDHRSEKHRLGETRFCARHRRAAGVPGGIG